jgi:hypothetical protein
MFNDNPNSGFISNQSLTNPSLSCFVQILNMSSSDTVKIGFSSSSTATTPDYGIYYYPTDTNITSIGGSGAIPYTLSTITLDLIVIGTKLKCYINSVEQPLLEATIPNGSYYLNCYTYVGTEIQVQNIAFATNHAQTLEDVLATGNDASGQNIIGVGALTVGTLNYTTLNPPLPTAQTFSQILASSGDGGGHDITNVSAITTGTLNYTTLNPPIPPSQWVGNATSPLIMNLHPIESTTYIAFNPNGILVPTKPILTMQSDSTSLTSGFSISQEGGANPGLIYDSYYNKPPFVATATDNLDMTGHAILNAASITLPGDELLSIDTQLTLTKDGLRTSGAIYDSFYNKPTLTQVLTGGNDAGNQDITNVKDLTVSTLNYTTLNPSLPTAQTFSQILASSGDGGGHDIINISAISTETLIVNTITQILDLTLLPSATYTNGTVIIAHSGIDNGFYTTNALFNPTIQANLVYTSNSGSNSMSFGYTKDPTSAKPIEYGIFFYPNVGYIQAIQTNAPYTYVGLSVLLRMEVSGNRLKTYVNGTYITALDQVIPPDNYQMMAYGFVNSGDTCTLTNLQYVEGTNLNLGNILAMGNDAGTQDIIGVKDLTCSTLNYISLNPPVSATTETFAQMLAKGSDAGAGSITNLAELTVGTVKYTTLDPPFPSATVPSLSQVLAVGSTAGGSNISNIGICTMANTTTNAIVLQSTPTTETFQLFGDVVSGKNYFNIQQYSGGSVKATPMIINDVDSINLTATDLIHNTNNYILDTSANLPIFTQAFSATAQDLSVLQQTDKIFSLPIYTKTTTLNFGLHSISLDISMLSLDLGSSAPFTSGTEILLYLAESITSYNPAQGNTLVIIPPLVSGFTYTIPYFKLWYTTANATPTNIRNLFLCIHFTQVNLTQGGTITGGFLASGYVSQVQANSISW